MKRSTTAVIVGVLALGLVGGGTAVALTGAGQDDPTPAETSLSEPTETPDTGQPDTDETPADDATEPLTAEDEAYLAEVERRQPPATVLGNFSDTEIIAMGHEGCDQIRDGVPIEDLRLVEGENGVEPRSWADTSAVFNSALLNYCPELLEEVD